MNNDDIRTLADLARLHISEEDAREYREDFDRILDYINTIESVEVKEIERSHVHYNAVRDDTLSYEPGEFTQALLREAPEVEDKYVVVSKIL